MTKMIKLAIVYFAIVSVKQISNTISVIIIAT